MAFVARKVTREEMNRICDLTDKENWDVATDRGMSDGLLASTRMVADEDKKELLIRLPKLRDYPLSRYLFCTADGCVHLQEEGYCQFLILNVSRSIADQMEYLTNQIRLAFRVGGTRLDGTPGLLNLYAVPDAQFIA